MVRKAMWIAIVLAIVSVGVFGIRAQMAVRAHPYDHGQAAPKFSLPSQLGTRVSLDQYKGKWLVVFCYSNRNLHRYLPDYLLQVPDGDALSENLIETEIFQRDLPKYEALNAAVVGLSPDSVEAHKAFSAKQALTFPLLTPDELTLDGFAVPYAGSGDSRTLERVTFLISPSGNIVKVWFVKYVQSHSQEVLNTIVAAQQPGYIPDSLRESPI
jgi:peroxiredoxin Q/BCP